MSLFLALVLVASGYLAGYIMGTLDAFGAVFFNRRGKK